MIRAYLAGPDVFLADAMEHARRKVELCAVRGIEGVPPLDDAPVASWRDIYGRNLALMQSCDIVIANLTPFRGASADAGTLVEIGWFLGRGRPVYGYSNGPAEFAQRSRRQRGLAPDPLPDLAVEQFDLSDNLMIVGACTLLELPPAGDTLPWADLAVLERLLEQLGETTSVRRSVRDSSERGRDR